MRPGPSLACAQREPRPLVAEPVPDRDAAVLEHQLGVAAQPSPAWPMHETFRTRR